MNKTVFSLIAGAGALAASSAIAGHHEEGKMDHEAKLEAKFAEVDANGDGNVSSEEYMAYKTAEAESEWAKWAESAGDDGMVSLEEAKAHQAAMMAEKEAMKKKDGDY
ncbi:hypothetical protein [Hyphococcus sp.]|uniref:hypothetical protein n=1 Tax=Hyphococcus sp. TaxID=2038636 RepID=UPI003CCBC7E4